MLRPLFVLTAMTMIAVAVSTGRTDEKPAAKPLPGAPDWLKTHQFPQKEFMFVRIEYGSRFGRLRGRRGSWATDYPDADLNLSAQLAAHTSLKVDPKGKIMKLTDPNLSEFPFIYLTEPGALYLTDDDVKSLRAYLDGGGFLMIDDFWGEAEWQNLRGQLARVFPSMKIQELPLEHKLFHCAFDLKEKPQVVSIHHYLSGFKIERADATDVHYRAIFDDKGRMQVLICHNTDLADGWERADTDAGYFKEYSEKRAFPMGINAIFFALTQKPKK